MTSTKRLKSVIHSTAHHAVSGLCYVHPHLGKACKAAGIESINVNLLLPEFEPELSTVTKEIQLPTAALRDKFVKFLRVENISVADLNSAYSIFSFLREGWPTICYIVVVTQEGIEVEVAVDSTGKTAAILRAHS